MYSFKKSERLCNKSIINSLYASDKRLIEYPLSAHWLILDKDSHPERLQVLIVAPKRKLHHAVDRNRTKRLMRECYRHRKERLQKALENCNITMALGINYLHNTVPDFHRLGHSFDKLFDNIIDSLAK